MEKQDLQSLGIKAMSLAELRALISKASRRTAEDIPPNANLIEEGFLDSFAVMELIQELEEKFDFVFEYDDLRRDFFQTAEGIYDLITEKYGVKRRD